MTDSSRKSFDKKRGAIKLDDATYRRIKLRQARLFAETGKEPTMARIMAEALDALEGQPMHSGPVEASAGAVDVELQQVIDFWAVAPKEDLHIVLSIVKRWLPDSPGESSKKLNAKRR